MEEPEPAPDSIAPIACSSATTITTTTTKFSCLICAAEEEEDGLSGGLIEGPDGNERIFSLLCTSLKIRLTKKNSWDFKKEALPFCPSCLEIARELVEIQGQIRHLETQFAGKVTDIRNLIIRSETENQTSGETEEIKKAQEREPRFDFFRCQVTGSTSTKKGRPRQDPRERRKKVSTSTPGPVLKLKKLTTLLEEPTNRRRSERVPKKIIPDLKDSEESDENETKFQDSEMDYDPYSPAVDNLEYVEVNYNSPDVKLFLTDSEIKQEDFHSELDNDFCEPSELLESQLFEGDGEEKHKLNSSSPSLPISTGLQDDTVNLTGKRARPKSTSNKDKQKKAKTYYVDYESDGRDRDEYDSDYEKSEQSSSSSDEEDESDQKDRTRRGRKIGTRKWKTCLKTQRYWYDGIEILPVPDGLKCTECDDIVKGDKNWKNKAGMKRHIHSKHLEKFPCKLCDKILSTPKYLKLHIQAVHEKSILIPCDICQKPFTSINAMRRHAWDHQSEEEKQAAIAAGKRKYGSSSKGKYELLQCMKCGKMCKGPFSLKQHEETHVDESERLKHMCQICGGLYSNPSCLKSHVRRQHDNNNRLQWLQCHLCPKKYPTRSQLQLHIRFHTGEKPFKCSECGSGFNTTRLLKNHMLKHQNLRPHKCQSCEMSFRQKYHLRRHREVYHDNPNPPTRKQPYRSEIGTRKPPQKRTKKPTQRQPLSVNVKPATTAEVPNNSQIHYQPQQHQPQPSSSNMFDMQPISIQHPIFGPGGNLPGIAHPETYGFSNSPYPFDYSSTARGMNQ